MLNKIFIVIPFFLLLASCIETGNTDEDNKGGEGLDTPEELIGSGMVKIHLSIPEGSNFDFQSSSLLNPYTQVNFGTNGYIIDKPKEHTAFFVLDKDSEPVMMGYNSSIFGGDDITVKSTAVGMLMMSPTILGLSNEGKKDFLEAILEDPHLKDLEMEIEKTIVAGHGLFDEKNVKLTEAYQAILQSVSENKRVAAEKDLPVNLFRAERNIIVNNKGKAFSTVVSLYNGNTSIKTTNVDGVKIIPSSFTELLSGYGGISGEPEDHHFELSGDGEFLMKFRTGRPGSGDGSDEHDQAFYENIAGFSAAFIEALLPSEVAGCYPQIRANAYYLVSNLKDITPNSSADLLTILYTVNIHVLGNVYSLMEKCGSGIKVEQKWFNSMRKLVSFASKSFTTTTLGASSSIFAFQWGMAEPVMDSCFYALGNLVTHCGDKVMLKGLDLESMEPVAGSELDIKIQVMTESELPVKDIDVQFSITSSQGIFSPLMAKTNAEGVATSLLKVSHDHTGDIDFIAEINNGIEVQNMSARITASIDSTEIYKKASLGFWTVNGYDPNNPTTTYTLELREDGSGLYHVGEGGVYLVRWDVVRTETGYKLFEWGFWHPAYDFLDREDLTFPITQFKTYSNFDPDFVSQIFIKN